MSRNGFFWGKHHPVPAVQVGLACLTPNRIPGLWKKYVMKQATLEQVQEGLLSDGEDDDGDKNED